MLPVKNIENIFLNFNIEKKKRTCVQNTGKKFTNDILNHSEVYFFRY